jgi:hypothetical protein
MICKAKDSRRSYKRGLTGPPPYQDWTTIEEESGYPDHQGDSVQKVDAQQESSDPEEDAGSCQTPGEDRSRGQDGMA